ncbi:N-acetylmannosamine kinase [Klebsiella sp. BIGb0407]|uniref:N-acetylmannosamine kinase n=1 Tax=Klebsiella sp. BIGb0407 TaxID=2940603 RepID=UPI0021696151|nr:N-acetylmannosamine kinase [Klebsiella sp. BIGb0407]MCS3434336.1 N-acylmannosamine kinase [Klebsiella sp. BIGb0407]
MKTLAIDIGGTKLAAALIDENHEITQRREIPTPGSTTPADLEYALSFLVKPYKHLATRVAVASTGIIDKGILTALNPDNLGGLNAFPLQSIIEALTGLPCSLLNDAQAAAWAEYSRLSTDIQNMVFITISTGVGGGVVINGKLLTGSHAFAGHLGHCQADPLGPLCGCGRTGCVEAIASGRAIAAAARQDLLGKDARAIFLAAQSGHQHAQQLVTRSAQAICQLIANLKALLDIECVVLGGSIGLALNYREQVEMLLTQLPPAFHVPIISAHFQHDAGLMGAALWLSDED